MTHLTRRLALLGGLTALGGCSTLSALNTATSPLDTYDLVPVPGSGTGRRSAATLLVARPQASAALSSDRILIKPDRATITYLPDARWSDEVPAVLQSLLIRSIAGTGRIAYVGRSDAGPVPDRALLGRIDAFEVNVLTTGGFETRVDFELTLINDSDQRIVASRRFAQTAPAQSEAVADIVGSFQAVADVLLPQIADWVIGNV
jgi:cholesterol transport system auxiliary component